MDRLGFLGTMSPMSIDATYHPAHGLTAPEVRARQQAGQVNGNADVKTKSVGRILKEHVCTLFNAVNLFLALLVVSTGQWRNMLFMLVVLCNLAIGTLQEVRAKRMVDRLTILTRQRVRCRRDGRTIELPPSDLVLDDVILLAHGDQIPADARVLSGEAHVDESLLTGESKPLPKVAGDELLSGSFLESGSVVARIVRIGREGYAARISAEAKRDKRVRSQMLDAIHHIIRLGTFALFPLGIGLFLRMWLSGRFALDDAILSTVAAVVGMIPQGLVLLVSSVLAIATTRLALRSVLVQQSYCVETLARVDTLCLDKTGTITTGDMEVARVVAAPGHDEGEVMRALAAVARATAEDANATGKALLAYAAERGVPEGAAPLRAVPFSSRRKFSGCVTPTGEALSLGAAGFLLAGGQRAQADELLAVVSPDPCERVLVVCRHAGFTADGMPTGVAELLGMVTLRDQLRPTAPATIRYFRVQGVDLRVISGDDPQTAAAIAQRAGIPHAEDTIDVQTLSTERQLRQAARRCHVFGRVTPEQKRLLVQALQADGHVVAMTGDGVNDILALREADCSISVASGSAAARNVSEIVLADDDFSHLPEVVAEGRRSINNLQRSASLFLVKTAYTAVLALMCILWPPYPFLPIQMSLLSLAIIGVPSFVLALEPNHDLVRGEFLRHVLARSLPASVSILVALGAALVLRGAWGLSSAEMSTLCLVLTAAVGTCLIWRISQPLTPVRTTLLVVVAAIVALGCTVFAPVFRVALLEPHTGLFALLVGLATCTLFLRLYDLSLRRLDGEDEGTELR